MNERILQLAEQANVNFGKGLEFAVVFGELEDFKKFAELLVQECATIADKNSPLSYPDHGIKIKRHFGVEE
jgi:hypothetical protein